MKPRNCTASSASCASCGNQCACTLSLYLLLCDAGCDSIALFFLDMPMHDQAKVQMNFCCACRVCGCSVPDDACRLVERMKGKYLSVKIQAKVQDADMIAAAYEELGQHPRVVMKF